MRGSTYSARAMRGALLLAARQRDAALADARVVAVREVGDVLVEPRDGRDLRARSMASAGLEPGPTTSPALGCTLTDGRSRTLARHLSAQRPRSPQSCPRTERLLRHDADRAAQRRQRHLAHVHAVDEHRARRRIVQPREQRQQRRLARSGAADDANGLPGLNRQRACRSSTGATP